MQKSMEQYQQDISREPGKTIQEAIYEQNKSVKHEWS